MRSLLVASALALALALPPVAAAHEGRRDPATQGPPGAARTPFDVQFLDTMAEHHRDGIKMFGVAADKAESRGLRDMARRMIDGQTREIAVLESMRAEVDPDGPQAVNMKLPGMKKMDMGGLESASGRAFDRRFIDMTVAHHRGGIEMSRAELGSGRSPQVKAKAREIIGKQDEEIAELRRIRDAMR